MTDKVVSEEVMTPALQSVEETPLVGGQSLLTDEQVAQMQQDDKNVFLEYTYDKVERVLSMEEVEAAVRTLMRLYAAQRAQAPAASDEEIRRAVCAESSETELFSTTHPTIFRKLTDRRTPPQVIETLCGMMGIRQRQERGELSDAQVAGGLEQYLRGQCAAAQKKTPTAAAAASSAGSQ